MLRKIPMLLVYRSGAETIRHEVMPLDVATRSGAEWLKFRKLEAEETIEIRLDDIVSFVELGCS